MKRSKFNLSYLNSTTADAGYLVPVYYEDCLPGDKLRIGFESFVRCQPILSPLMHQVNLYMQYWFVPYRLLWDRWTEFITGGSDGVSVPVMPYVVSPLADPTSEDAQVKVGGFARGSFADYFFGADVRKPGVSVSAFPFRANVLIWNTRYRDEDLQLELPISFGDGEDTETFTGLLSPCIKKDYFSTARNNTQRGSQISVPILNSPSDSSSGQYYHFDIEFGLYETNSQIPDYTSYTPVASSYLNKILTSMPNPFTPNANYVNPAITSKTLITSFKETFSKSPLSFTPNVWLNLDRLAGNSYPHNVYGCFKVSLRLENGINETSQWLDSQDTSFLTWSGQKITFGGSLAYHSSNVNSSSYLDIRDLRLASSLQRYQERSLLWGNRYEEFLQREFSVRPSDARIQRPEFLGGCKSQLLISEVLQTSEGDSTGVGTMRGNGVGVLRQRPIRFFAPEHGIVIGYLSIRPKHVYTSGIDRAWLKKTRFDYYTPELSSVGMQEVLQQEISANADNAGVVFGFQDRYQEYRSRKDRVSGEFVDLLNYWNMATSYAEPPLISSEFVDMQNYADSYKRPFLVQDNSYHSYLCMIANKVRSYRPISKVSKNILK